MGLQLVVLPTKTMAVVLGSLPRCWMQSPDRTRVTRRGGWWESFWVNDASSSCSWNAGRILSARGEESRLLDESLVERRRTQTEAVGCKRHIAHLEMELEFVEQEIKHWEDDLVGMHEADDAAGDRRYSEGERRYILEKME